MGGDCSTSTGILSLRLDLELGVIVRNGERERYQRIGCLVLALRKDCGMYSSRYDIEGRIKDTLHARYS